MDKISEIYDGLKNRADLWRNEAAKLSSAPGSPEWFQANAKYIAFTEACEFVMDVQRKRR